MRLGIVTYALPHLKTEQVLHGLLLRGETGIEVYALPFQARPERTVRFQHRPHQFEAAHPGDVARRFGLRYCEIASTDAINDPPDLILVTVGALVAPALIARTRVINCHAGLIPTVRGLDAFKWAVHDMMPLGVTLHFVDAEIDRGEHILALPTPVYPGDTLASLARRHYEAEVALLIGFRDALALHTAPPDLPERPARKRMPTDTEAVMIGRFPEYLARHAG